MGGIAQQLREIQGRLNYLETRMADLDPQGSQRVLDRCTELEGLMREHCNKVFAIMKSNGTEILKTMERADQLVKVGDAKTHESVPKFGLLVDELGTMFARARP